MTELYFMTYQTIAFVPKNHVLRELSNPGITRLEYPFKFTNKKTDNA